MYPEPEWRIRYRRLFGQDPPPWRLGNEPQTIVAWIREYLARHGRKPTVSEIQQVFGLSKTTAWRLLIGLRGLGFRGLSVAEMALQIAGQEKSRPIQHLAFGVPEWVRAGLDLLAKKYDRPVSDIVNDALAAYLNKNGIREPQR